MTLATLRFSSWSGLSQHLSQGLFSEVVRSCSVQFLHRKGSHVCSTLCNEGHKSFVFEHCGLPSVQLSSCVRSPSRIGWSSAQGQAQHCEICCALLSSPLFRLMVSSHVQNCTPSMRLSCRYSCARVREAARPAVNLVPRSLRFASGSCSPESAEASQLHQLTF